MWDGCQKSKAGSLFFPGFIPEIPNSFRHLQAELIFAGTFHAGDCSLGKARDLFLQQVSGVCCHGHIWRRPSLGVTCRAVCHLLCCWHGRAITSLHLGSRDRVSLAPGGFPRAGAAQPSCASPRGWSISGRAARPSQPAVLCASGAPDVVRPLWWHRAVAVTRAEGSAVSRGCTSLLASAFVTCTARRLLFPPLWRPGSD